MKATELQIGDFVYANVHLYDPNHIPEILPVPVKVIEIGTNVVVEYIFKNTIRNYILPLDRLIPIQLTAEILEKNGFVYDGCIIGEDGYNCKSYNLNDSQVWGYLTEEGFDIVFGGDNQPNDIIIKSVHELQHALRLCGLDELADNFKI